ncbi:MAG: YciI family protein [Gammaproteobacteria bacterium]
MFIVILTYRRPIEEIDQYVAEHRAFLESCYQKKLLIASGPQVPRTGGVLLARGGSQSQLEGILREDPFYQQGLADYHFIEFNPIKYDPDFASFLTAVP